MFVLVSAFQFLCYKIATPVSLLRLCRAISKRMRVKKVFEGPPLEKVVTNISATKADWTLEEHVLSAMQHIYEDGLERLEMTAL